MITPGWRKVRSFLRAFFARGSRDLFAVMSKEKMLQFEPSSCGACQVLVRLAQGLSTLCIHVWCHCAGSIWTGRHRQRRRTNMGMQGPWRSQMRRRTLGNPWRRSTLLGQERWLATHRRRRRVRAGLGDLEGEKVLERRGVGVLGAKDTGASSGTRLPSLSPDAPPSSGLRTRSRSGRAAIGATGSPR